MNINYLNVKSKDSNKNDLSFNRDSKIEKAPGRNTLQVSKVQTNLQIKKNLKIQKKKYSLKSLK